MILVSSERIPADPNIQNSLRNARATVAKIEHVSRKPSPAMRIHTACALIATFAVVIVQVSRRAYYQELEATSEKYSPVTSAELGERGGSNEFGSSSWWKHRGTTDTQTEEEIDTVAVGNSKSDSKITWKFETPIKTRSKKRILRNHYTPFCVHQPGTHGTQVLAVSFQGQVLETVQVPMYKGKGCALLSGKYENVPSGGSLTAGFSGSEQRQTSLQLVDVSCSSQMRDGSMAVATCLQRGIQNGVSFKQDLIVLPMKGASISNKKLSFNRGVLFTHFSNHSVGWSKSGNAILGNYFSLRDSKKHTVDKPVPLLSLNKVFLRGERVWFAFGSRKAPNEAPALIHNTGSSVALQKAVFVGSGPNGCIMRSTHSRLQIQKSELYSRGGIAQLELHESYAVLYRIHSMATSGYAALPKPNFVIDRQLSLVLCPVIWMSIIVNWCSADVALLKSVHRLNIRESVVEQNKTVTPGFRSLMMTDVFQLSPKSMIRIYDAHSGNKSLINQEGTSVRYFYSRSKFTPLVYADYSIPEFLEGFNLSTSLSPELSWITKMSLTADLMTLSSSFEPDRCPSPTNDSKYGAGSQNFVFSTKLSGFDIVVRYARRGDSAKKMSHYAHTFVHPTMAFRFSTCMLPSGKTGELYRWVPGGSLKTAKPDLDLETIYNIALDAVEAFGFLHDGNPYGWAGHGDSAVGYFQNKKLQPKVKNIAIDFNSQRVHVFDFETSRVPSTGIPFTQPSKPRSMRNDLKAIGFLMWHLAGQQMSKRSIIPENNFKLIESCRPSLRAFRKVAYHCIHSGDNTKTLTVEDVYEQLLKSIPAGIWDGKN